jgi:hypothetical protein
MVCYCTLPMQEGDTTPEGRAAATTGAKPWHPSLSTGRQQQAQSAASSQSRYELEEGRVGEGQLKAPPTAAVELTACPSVLGPAAR